MAELCMAPGCGNRCEGGAVVRVAGSRVALCKLHASQVKAGVTGAAVELARAAESRMPGVVALAVRGLRTWRAWMAPEPEPEREVIEVEVVDVTPGRKQREERPS